MAKKLSKRYRQQAEEIRTRLKGRSYSMGLDLGVGSIGLAIAAMEESKNYGYEPTDLVFVTSRIFTPSIGASERREKRGQRNALRHRRNRLIFLWKLLAERKLMLPYSTKSVDDPARLRFKEAMIQADPYKLRLKGLTEALTLSELGYALYHIANHRGASSIRTFLDEVQDADEKKLEEQRSITNKIMAEYNVSTFIEVLTIFNRDTFVGYRNVDKLKGKSVPVPTRDIISAELDRLLLTQAQFHPQTLSEDYIQRIKDAILYENEKIVPEPGNCPYFPDEKKLPRCHFLNEERRLWEAINNARLGEPDESGSFRRYNQVRFSDKERQELFDYLRSGKSVTAATIAKTLFPRYKNHEIILQGRDRKTSKIEGFRFRHLEEKPFWARFTEEQQDEFFAIWTNFADEKRVEEHLVMHLGLSEEEAADAIKTVKLIGDYGPLGKTATLLLMKYIEDGDTYTEAVMKAVEAGEFQETATREVQEFLPYYGKILSESTQALMGKYWHSSFKDRIDRPGFVKPNTDREEEVHGRIANPVVHQTLNEMRKVVNEVIEILGSKPSEIVVELARDLKVGAEKREEISKEQQKNEATAQRIYDTYCKKNGLSKRYIQAFRLYEDQQFICPYCLETISVAEIAGNQTDIDHIFPIEDTSDNSYANKVLAHGSCNKEKGKRTPYAAFGHTEKWGRIMHYLDATPSMKAKRWRFEKTDDEYAEYLQSKGFMSRFATDNSYIATAAFEYLACLFDYSERNSVRTTKGWETSILRKAWNLQGIDDYFGSMHWDKKDSPDSVKGKNRGDHRHHGLDAMVTLYTSRSLIKQINTLSSKGLKAEKIESLIPIPNYYRDDSLLREDQRNLFRKYVQSFFERNAFVSVKTNHAINGPLVKDTVYSILGANPKGDELVFVVNKKVKDIAVKQGTVEEVESAIRGRFSTQGASWYDDELRMKIEAIQRTNEEIIDRYKSNLVQAERTLIEENRKLEEEGKKQRTINEKLISKKALELSGGTYQLLSNNSRVKTFVVKEPTATSKGYGFDTGSSLCIDLYHNEEGKLQGEIIRKVYAMDPDYTPMYKQKGYKLFERIYGRDILEITASSPVPEEKEDAIKKVARVRVPNAMDGRTYVKVDTFTEAGPEIRLFLSNIAKADGGQDASFRIGSMQQYDVRKVQLSPAGLVEYVSPVLKDLEMEG
ncbi:MAG: type II CRISPR RNA-guided endonuclease Cas9 [Spirochaetales bacterium]|nr:type II CRISPR RNA-guided endonuclease Cas9 [Spirochaetales bacterium]